jgi:hypothetical protein
VSFPTNVRNPTLRRCSALLRQHPSSRLPASVTRHLAPQKTSIALRNDLLQFRKSSLLKEYSLPITPAAPPENPRRPLISNDTGLTGHALYRLAILDRTTPQEYGLFMLMVIETSLFQKPWPHYWTEDERGAFASCTARHPVAGDVVPESGGIRKVRWGRAGAGKSSGVRVIYFTRSTEGEVVLLTLYAKSKTDNLTGSKLKEIRHALEG